MHSDSKPRPSTASHPRKAGAKPKKNNRKKGDRIEGLARAVYKNAGFRVEPRPLRAKFIEGRVLFIPVDWFGLFDFLAIKDGRAHWVQVCADVSDDAAKRRRALATESLDFCNEFSFIELLRYRQGRARKADRLARGFIREVYDRHELEYVVVPLPAKGDLPGVPALAEVGK